MTIFLDSDGWRDLSDEGPVYDLRDWEDYEIIRYEHNSPIIVKRQGEHINASFSTIDLAKRWCERDFKRRKKEKAGGGPQAENPGLDW